MNTTQHQIGGIDLGGSKIEARRYDASMTEVDRHRIETPKQSYDALLNGLAEMVRWLDRDGPLAAIGVGAPGLIDPVTGKMLTANLPASGHALGEDLGDRTGRPIALINDARAFALSEATAGAGQGAANVVGLIIGTGVAGGHVVNGALVPDLNGQQGEYGHLPLSAELVARHDLPLVACGCGLTGCFETYLSGPGLTRLAQQVDGISASSPEIMDDARFAKTQVTWLAIAAALVAVLSRTADPALVVLGGGLGSRPELPERISQALDGLLLTGTRAPRIETARFGDASGARGAALFARATATP